MDQPNIVFSLTTSSLKRVLEAGRAGHRLPDTPLQHSVAFEITSGVPSVYLSKDALDCHTLEWLSQLITARLISQREYHRINSPKPNGTSEALATLLSDFLENSQELEAWSVLYHRFVRVDLDLSWQQIGQLTANTERTLRRRQERGLRRLLTDILFLEKQLQKYGIRVVANTRSLSTSRGCYGEDIRNQQTKSP